MRLKTNFILKTLFIIYTIIMFWLLFGQRFAFVHYNDYSEQLKWNINLTPLLTIKNYIRLIENTPNLALVKHAFINLLGNIIMFIPLGFFLPAVHTKLRTFWKCLLSVILIIIFVETLQLFTLLGRCDIDDLIFNVIGSAIGYFFFKTAYFISLKRREKQTQQR